MPRRQTHPLSYLILSKKAALQPEQTNSKEDEPDIKK